MKYGNAASKKACGKYWALMHRCRMEDIEITFTLDEWVEWWEKHLGKDWYWKHGNFTGQYKMSRIDKKGPYAPHNVRCVQNKLNEV